MEKLNILDFNAGIDYVVQTILNEPERPVLVSIHGAPHTGKTELRRKVRYELEVSHGKRGWGGMQGSSLEGLRAVTGDPDYFLIEDMPYTEAVDLYTRTLFNRTPHLKVFITREFVPSSLGALSRQDIEAGIYGLIIINPDATDK